MAQFHNCSTVLPLKHQTQSICENSVINMFDSALLAEKTAAANDTLNHTVSYTCTPN